MKTVKAFSLATIAVVTALITACHKEGTQPTQSKYFPNDKDDSWVYAVTDSTQSTSQNPSPPEHYQVTVTIKRAVTLADGKSAMLWQYQYPFGLDTSYVRQVGDTIKIFDNTYYISCILSGNAAMASSMMASRN